MAQAPRIRHTRRSPPRLTFWPSARVCTVVMVCFVLLLLPGIWAEWTGVQGRARVAAARTSSWWRR